MRVAAASHPEHTLCLLFNHAGHPNVMSGDNLFLSADYPGAACRRLEQEWGGLALFVNGAQGSVDIDGLRHRDWEGVERAGEALAQAVSEAANGIPLEGFQIPDSRFQMREEGARGERDSSAPAWPRVLGPPAVGMTRSGIHGASQTFTIPARSITKAEWEWAEQVLAHTGGRVEPMADGVGDDYKAVLYRRLRESAGKAVALEQSCFALGDTAFLTVPCELYTEIGLRLKAQSPFPRTLIMGLANGNLGYVPTRKAISEGGYAEDTRGLDDSAEDLLTAASLDLLRRVHEMKE